MTKAFTLFILLVFQTIAVFAQSVLKGTIVNNKGVAVAGASVSIENTLDGATTNDKGYFEFSTAEKGQQILSITGTGFEPYTRPINLDAPMEDMVINLGMNNTTLEQITITAGGFGSADGTQKTVLDPLDVVTTAGAGADPILGMQMLPGVQKNGAVTGLLVRGGDASEAAIIVDGLTLQNPFFSETPGVQQRSRFSAFDFKGIAFSSGGYSARYGQAMSSVLEMNTLDIPNESTVNVGLNMAGIYASANKNYDDNHQSIGAAINYNNLSPFYGIASTNFDFYDVPKGAGGSVNYLWKTKSKGLLKVMGNYAQNNMGIRMPNPFAAGESMEFGMKNNNAYAQATFKQELSEKLRWFTAASYSFNNDDSKWGTFTSVSKEQRAQARTELNWFASAGFSLLGGAEVQQFAINRNFFDSIDLEFSEQQIAPYLEADWLPIHWLAIRPGIRLEYSKLLQTTTLSPRLSASAKAGKFSSVSLSGGLFYQNADKQYLLQGYRPKQQQAAHAIANYMFIKNDRTLRIEAYTKQYSQLVRELVSTYDPNAFRYIYGNVDNSGSGFANGIELFYRDKKSVKNFDYWLTYSYINTERLYKNFITHATPDFISNHNLNAVGKYWFTKWNTMISGTYSFATGKPYYDPNSTGFLQDVTPNFHNVALQVSHLRTIGKWFTVFYVSVDNVLNTKNIFGYRYSLDGQSRFPIQPAMYRTIFAGVNFSLTKFDKEEL